MIGQVNDFTNFLGPYVWDVTNSTGFNRIQVEYKTSPGGAQPTWATVTNQQQYFTLHNNLPVNATMLLYIRVTAPPTSTTLGPYTSRVRVEAVKP